MAKTVTTDREKDIAEKIRGVCAGIIPDTDSINEKREEISALNEGLVVSKLGLAAQIAQMSSVDKWLPGEIKSAVAYAASTGNADPNNPSTKSLAVFMSEMKQAADPKVRDQFPQIVKIVEEAWAQEDELKKAELPTPIRKWSSRKYHTVLNVARAIINDKGTFASVADLTSYAIANDPDHNAERVAKRLEALSKTLAGIMTDFADDDVGQAYRLVSTITAEDLLKSRAKLLAEREKARREHKNLRVVPTTVVTPEPEQVAAEQIAEPIANEPAQGVSDVLDDVLNDQQHLIDELAA